MVTDAEVTDQILLYGWPPSAACKPRGASWPKRAGGREWGTDALGWLILVLVIVALAAAVFVVVQRRRRGGGVIATKGKP